MDEGPATRKNPFGVGYRAQREVGFVSQLGLNNATQ
jgi:hypothetical protein